MKVYLVAALVALAAALTGCAHIGGGQTVHGSGRIESEPRAVSSFSRVSVSGSGQLTVLQGIEEGLEIEADDNLLPFIRSEVINGQLRLGPQNVSLRPSGTIRYTLKLKNLNELHLSGSIRAEVDTLQTERLLVAISGSGRIQIGRLNARDFSARMSGSGDTSAAGQVETQDIHISGSGNHQASQLQCARAKVNISGSGHASLWVSELLTANISGSGLVEYHGAAAVDAHVSGSGRVRHLAGTR